MRRALVCAAVWLVSVVAAAAPADEAERLPSVGQAAPALAGYAVDGKMWTLKGALKPRSGPGARAVVVGFFATWCHPCEAALPSDAVSGQMSLALALVAIVWNSLVAGFVVQVVRQHFAGRPNWLLTWLIVPFVIAGAWTIYALVRQILLTSGTGNTLLEIADVLGHRQLQMTKRYSHLATSHKAALVNRVMGSVG